MKKSTAIAAALSFISLGQPLVIGAGAVLTNVAIILSTPEKAQANPPLRTARDSQGRTMKFYINRALKKIKNGDRRGGNRDYTTAITMHERDPYGGDIYYYKIALTGRGISKNVLGNRRGACFDIGRAKDYVGGLPYARKMYKEICN